MVYNMDMNGTILYRGPSNFDQKPIVVIATGLKTKSTNSKTGKMIQVYILSDQGDKPSDALFKTGSSTSCCGDCKHDQWGTCYVNIGQGGNAVYKGLMNGSYPVYNHKEHAELFKDKMIRFGTYGDPAMVPIKVWKPFIKLAKGHTAYTHQWDKPWASEYKSFCMASVDTKSEYADARALGWRTFRVTPESEVSEKGLKRETVCPASAEANVGKDKDDWKQCEDCMLCSGGDATVTVRIAVHGTGYKSRRFNDIMELVKQDKPYNDGKLIPLKISARPLGKTNALQGVK
jgi:hypothetical protein